MSVPSMVHRSRNTSIVRSAANGDAQDGYSSSSNVDVDEDSAADAEDDNNSKELPACKVKRNYSCSSCDFFTQNPRHFLYHLRDVHREKVRIYECPNCLYASRHFQKLLRHSRMVHGGGGDSAATKTARGAKSGNSAATAATPQHPTSEDEEALSPSPSAGDASMDIDEFDGAALESTVFKCSVCAFTARNQALLGRHEREEHIKTKFFRCTKCTYVTHMKARFTKHVKYHSMPMIKCDMCDFRTPYKWNLDRHCKNHNGKGAFRCSACNFTADIKQSLTVHEMNHHVPPVGQAAGLGVGRRRNKVGASDATAAEEAARIHQSHQVAARNSDAAANDDDDADVDSDGPHPQQVQHKPQPAKKPKITTTILHHSPEQGSFGPDFIHPDDIIQHANGNVYIKNKCKLCSFKSAWDGEMAKHEMKVHNIHRELPPQKAAAAKKPTRPIPNLIPIPSQAAALRRKPDAHAELPSQPPVPADPS